MHNAGRMCCIQRVRELDSQVQHVFEFHGTALYSMLQRYAVQELHRDERLVFVFADLVNCANVWVIQGGGGTRFPPKAFERLRVSGHILRQKF